MNWDAIGALAELIGACGVIVSIVYLAVQVRQNTKALRLDAAHKVMKAFAPPFRQRLMVGSQPSLKKW